MPDIELGGMLGIAGVELGGMPILLRGIPMLLGGMPMPLGGMGPGIPPTGVTGLGGMFGMLGGSPLECVTEGPNWELGEILP